MDALSGHGGGIVEALNAKIYGNGTQTFVLSHGYGTDQSVWHYLLPYLACYFKVIVFDLVFAPNVNPNLYVPNKYKSFNGYATDLVNLLDELNVNNTIFMGHSISAMIGCLASIGRPDLFQQLILLNGSPRYLNATGYDGGFNREQLNMIFNQIDQNFSNWVPAFAPQAIGVNDTTAIKEFENSLGRMRPKIALDVAKMVYLSDERSILPRVTLPCTIIQSEQDIVVTPFVPRYMKRKLGGEAKVKILKTKGHLPHLTAYTLLLKTLEKVHIIKKSVPWRRV